MASAALSTTPTASMEAIPPSSDPPRPPSTARTVSGSSSTSQSSLPTHMLKALQDREHSDPIPIPRKSANPAAGIKPHPTARYVALSFPNSLLPSYVLNQSGTTFTDCNFLNAQWSRPASGSNNHQTSVRFETCELKGSSFHHVVLDDCRWNACEMVDVNFKRCRFLRTAKFVGCDLRNTTFEGARFYRLEFVDCKLDGCSFKDVFIHTLAMEGPKTTLRQSNVTGMIIANLSTVRATSNTEAPLSTTPTQNPPVLTGSPQSTNGLPSSLPSTPKSSRKALYSEPGSPIPGASSLASLTSTGTMSMPDLLTSTSSLTSFPDPSYHRHSPDSEAGSANSPAPRSPIQNPSLLPSDLETPFSPSPTTPTQSIPLPPNVTPEDRESVKAAESIALAAAAALEKQPAPLPLADLLHLSWKGAYFGAGAMELHMVKSKVKKAAAGGIASAAGPSGNGFGVGDVASPISGGGGVLPAIAEVGWARTIACLQKIVAGDYRDPKSK